MGDGAIVGARQTLIAEQPPATGPAIELVAQGSANNGADGAANDQAENASADFANPSHPGLWVDSERGKR